MFPLTIH